MSYDFDTPVDRRNTNSLKWDVGENELPMRVADMDFPAAPEIRSAIEKRAAHGVFGCSILPDSWYEAYQNWRKTRHFQHRPEADHPGGKGADPDPVYNIFFHSILNNGRQVLACPLTYDGESHSVNFSAFERAVSDPQTSLFILYNPHNPEGKIWRPLPGWMHFAGSIVLWSFPTRSTVT